MQTIKFRAWNGTRMYYATLDDLLFAMGSQGAGDWTLVEQVGEELAEFSGQHSRNMLYTQFTGLIDKHGKDVYEGDIIKADWHWIEPHVFDFPNDFYWIQEVSLEGGNLEVVGNIYEHPHLVK